MTDDPNWTPWIEHDGDCRPVPAGTIVNVIMRSRITGEVRNLTAPCRNGQATGWITSRGLWPIVLRYRIRRYPDTMREINEAMNSELEDA